MGLAGPRVRAAPQGPGIEDPLRRARPRHRPARLRSRLRRLAAGRGPGRLRGGRPRGSPRDAAVRHTRPGPRLAVLRAVPGLARAAAVDELQAAEHRRPQPPTVRVRPAGELDVRGEYFPLSNALLGPEAGHMSAGGGGGCVREVYLGQFELGVGQYRDHSHGSGDFASASVVPKEGEPSHGSSVASIEQREENSDVRLCLRLENGVDVVS